MFSITTALPEALEQGKSHQNTMKEKQPARRLLKSVMASPQSTNQEKQPDFHKLCGLCGHLHTYKTLPVDEGAFCTHFALPWTPVSDIGGCSWGPSQAYLLYN